MRITLRICYFILRLRKLVHGNILIRFYQGFLFMKKAIKAFIGLVFKNCIPLLSPFCQWFRGYIYFFYGQVDIISLYYWMPIVCPLCRGKVSSIFCYSSKHLRIWVRLLFSPERWENGGLARLNNLTKVAWLILDGAIIWIKFFLTPKPMFSATASFCFWDKIFSWL